MSYTRRKGQSYTNRYCNLSSLSTPNARSDLSTCMHRTTRSDWRLFFVDTRVSERVKAFGSVMSALCNNDATAARGVGLECCERVSTKVTPASKPVGGQNHDNMPAQNARLWLSHGQGYRYAMLAIGSG